MGAAPKIIDKKTLQILVPFNALSPMHFNEVAQKTVVEEVRAGRLIFKEGERDNQSIYLLEGEISLLAGNEVVGAVAARTDASRHPIAQQQPRQVSARAKSNVVVARIDSSLLDIMLTWDQSSGYEVAEISEDDDDDWMTRILQSQAFLKLPPSNIQRLLMRVESISVSAGEVIIRQGGDGDYFYIIKSGRCMVTRKPSANAKEVKLAELADGDAFGEDALVSDAKRNATITMMTEGVLMRLAKKDFVELLKEPLLAKLGYQEALAKITKGAEWLDVRLPGEYENVHIRGSRNIPLSALRIEANGLDPGIKYIVCCDTGRRSASAAFVLSQRGFEVYVLSDGFAGVPAEALEGNVAIVPANLTPESAAVVALKPSIAPGATSQPGFDGVEWGALRQQIEVLQQEKQALEAARLRADGRVEDLQEELTRVRDESREQILELEQILAEVRSDVASAKAELRAAQDALETQLQTTVPNGGRAESLETELNEHHVRESELLAELEALRSAVSEMEAAKRVEHSQLKEQTDQLQFLSEQSQAQRAQIELLENALQAAVRDKGLLGDQEAYHARQITELNAALDAEREEHANQRAAIKAELLALRSVEAELRAQLSAAEARELALNADKEEIQQSIASAQIRLDAEKLEALEQRTRLEGFVEESNRLQAEYAEKLSEQCAEVSDLRAQLEEQCRVAATLLAERDCAMHGATRAEEARAELTRHLDEVQSAAEAIRADSQTQLQELQAELESVRHQAAERADEQSRLQAALNEMSAERDALKADVTDARSQLAELRIGADEQVIRLQALLNESRAEIENETQARVAAAAELIAGRARIGELQADAAEQAEKAQGLQERVNAVEQALSAARDEQARELASIQSELRDALTRLQEADSARSEIEGRLTEMTAAAGAAQAQLEQGEKIYKESLAEAEQRAHAEAAKQVYDLRSELEGARAALAREISERANLEQAQQAEFSSAQAEVEKQLEQAEYALGERERALSAADAARREIQEQLNAERRAAEEDRRALQMELDQLRAVTSADLETMQLRIGQLQEELRAARKLGAGGPAEEEIDRLRLLLDEAREVADSARMDADQWREQALSASNAKAPLGIENELAAVRIQLADAQSRAAEALQSQEEAYQELASLRQTIPTQTQVAASAVESADPARHGGLWRGLVAGLAIGAIGVGIALWSGGGGNDSPVELSALAPALSENSHPSSGTNATAPKNISPAGKAPTSVKDVSDSSAQRTATQKGRVFRDRLVDGSPGPRLVEVAAAEFSMGSSPNSVNFDERPRHKVSLQAFAISQHEITFEEYEDFARATGRRVPDDKGWGRGRLPVISVSWGDAVAYTEWLSEQTGKRYRLPTEAEWEYAGGGFIEWLYWWGNVPGQGRANCFNCESDWDAKRAAPVGSFEPNPLGLFDTAGNVAEWVQDCYHSNYDGAPADGSAWVEVGCTRRVVRGGGFNSPANTLRIAKRDQQPSNMQADDIGFRVVREF